MNNNDIKIIKAEIQSFGIRTNSNVIKRGGAGPAEGDTILLNKFTAATIPISSKFVEESPYTIVRQDDKLGINV